MHGSKAGTYNFTEEAVQKYADLEQSSIVHNMPYFDVSTVYQRAMSCLFSWEFTETYSYLLIVCILGTVIKRNIRRIIAISKTFRALTWPTLIKFK